MRFHVTTRLIRTKKMLDNHACLPLQVLIRLQKQPQVEDITKKRSKVGDVCQ